MAQKSINRGGEKREKRREERKRGERERRGERKTDSQVEGRVRNPEN